jgi:hypothetical protein
MSRFSRWMDDVIPIKKYSPVFVCYIVIVIIQIVYTRYNISKSVSSNIDKQIKFNKENYNELENIFHRVLTERIELLTSGKMKYTEWVEYMNKENTITYKGYSYYFFAWERGKSQTPSGPTFTSIVHNNPKYINMNWDDVYKEVSEIFVFIKQTIDPELIKSFFELGKPNNQIIKYYWIDPVDLVPVQKISIIDVIPETKEHHELAVGIGIDVSNLDEIDTLYYTNYIHKSYIVLVSLVTLVISIIIYVFSEPNNKYKSFLFLVLSNIYITYFLNNKEYNGTPDTEIEKINTINSGMLAVSFLVGVNTYILTQLTNIKEKELFIQSALIFAISIILLLVSSFKITDAITVNNLIEDRISHQMVFNFSVLLNIVVVSNYLISVLRKKIKI